MCVQKLLSIICVCALACGFSACGIQRDEPYIPQYNNGSVSVEQGDVITSSEVTNQGFLDLLERMRGNAYRPLRKCYIVSRQQSYRSHWNRVIYYAFPKFTNEIKGPGARNIRQYYKKQYQNCTAAENFPWLDTYEEITDNAEEAMQYRLLVYAVDLLADYVVVNLYMEAHLGGGHIMSLPTADVFDRKTGSKLALNEAVALEDEDVAQAINQAVADYLRMNDIKPLEPYDVRKAQDQAFSLSEDGPVLLFAPGTLAPDGYGVIRVLVDRLL